MSALAPLIGLLVRQAANINLPGRLITLRSSLGIAAIGSYKVGTAGRSIFITSLADSSGSLVLSTLSALSLAVLLWALKTAPNLSLISLISLISTSACCVATADKLLYVYCVA